MRYVASLLIALGALLGVTASFPAKAHTLCYEGETLQKDPQLTDIRPTRTAVCPYDFDALNARIRQLITTEHAPYSVETVETVFGIPQMTTDYDSNRTASYMAQLSGKGGWKLTVWVRESFYPLDKGSPAFVPGLRPRRLRHVKDADLRIDLTILGSSPTLGSIECSAVSPIVDEALQAGWKDIRMKFPPPTDGGAMDMMLGKGDKAFSVHGRRGECAQNITLMQEAKYIPLTQDVGR